MFNADALNQDIAAQYGDKFGSNPALEPNCPPSQPVVVGTSFTCYGRLSTGESQKVEVKVHQQRRRLHVEAGGLSEMPVRVE